MIFGSFESRKAHSHTTAVQHGGHTRALLWSGRQADVLVDNPKFGFLTLVTLTPKNRTVTRISQNWFWLPTV